MIGLLLAVRIIFIGNTHDLRGSTKIVSKLGRNVINVSFSDPSARSRYRLYDSSMARSLWTNRYFNTYAKRLPYNPKIVVVFGRETLKGGLASDPFHSNPPGCLNDDVITCKASDLKGCVEAIEGTWCK